MITHFAVSILLQILFSDFHESYYFLFISAVVHGFRCNRFLLLVVSIIHIKIYEMNGLECPVIVYLCLSKIKLQTEHINICQLTVLAFVS